MTTENVTLYTRSEACPWCEKAKELLTSNNISYTEIIVTRDITREDFIQKFWPGVVYPRPTVPQLVIGGKHIGGYEDMKKFFEGEN
jgi:glutaredoxin